MKEEIAKYSSKIATITYHLMNNVISKIWDDDLINKEPHKYLYTVLFNKESESKISEKIDELKSMNPKYFNENGEPKLKPLKLSVSSMARKIISNKTKDENLEYLITAKELYDRFSKYEHFGILTLDLIHRQFKSERLNEVFQDIFWANKVILFYINNLIGIWLKKEDKEYKVFEKLRKEIITKDLKIIESKKGTFLLKEGQNSYDNYFVLSGCVRQYIIKDGAERVTNFYTEEDWILPAISQESNLVSKYFLDCVEDSFLVIANDKEGSELMRTNLKFQELAQLILEKEITNQQQHFAEFQSSTPEERYLNLQKTRPDLIERVPQFQLSSYIGVKPESLSRIRKRIAKKWNS